MLPIFSPPVIAHLELALLVAIVILLIRADRRLGRELRRGRRGLKKPAAPSTGSSCASAGPGATA